MEIIDELELYRRGPYGGMVGIIDFDGNANTAIVIRTLVEHEGTYYVQAGAGIAADSNPEQEWQECDRKLGALSDVLGCPETGNCQVTLAVNNFCSDLRLLTCTNGASCGIFYFVACAHLAQRIEHRSPEPDVWGFNSLWAHHNFSRGEHQLQSNGVGVLFLRTPPEEWSTSKVKGHLQGAIHPSGRWCEEGFQQR